MSPLCRFLYAACRLPGRIGKPKVTTGLLINIPCRVKKRLKIVGNHNIKGSSFNRKKCRCNPKSYKNQCNRQFYKYKYRQYECNPAQNNTGCKISKLFDCHIPN